MTDRKAFNFYKSHWAQIKHLTDKQKLDLFNAICSVQFLEVNINDIYFNDKLTNLIWIGFKHSIETSLKGFITKNKGLNKDIKIPLAKGGIEDPCQEEEGQEKEEEKEKEEVQKSKRFVEPTIKQVEDYCSDRKNDVNPLKFHSYYSANGWMVGKNKMKDWKAAVRTWENKNGEQKRTKPKLAI